MVGFSAVYCSLTAVILFVIANGVIVQSAIDNDDSSCSNDFFNMEQALLQNTDNRFNLLVAFFPPREPHPVLVTVRYLFRNTNDTRIWYWTESVFYLIQPLEVFQFTSLLFGNLPYRHREVAILLDSSCTNASEEYYLLLTTRLKLYAQSATTGPDATTQRISNGYIAIAYNSEDKSNDLILTTFAKVWFHLTLFIFPLLTWLVLYLCDPVQLLLGDKTWTKLEDEHTHGTLAAMIQIAVILTTIIFILDIFGIYYTVTSTNIANSDTAFYLSMVTGLFVDVGAFFWVVFVLISSCDYKKFKRNLKNEMDPELNISGRVKKLFSTITIAPVLCISNHVHYIVIAFMADPFHAGSTAIIYILSFFLYFFVFRQFYNRVVLHSNKRPKIVSRMELCPKCLAKEKTWNPLSQSREPNPTNGYSTIEESLRLTAESVDNGDIKCNCFIPGPNCHAPFNTQVVLLGIVVIGPFLLIYQAIAIILFYSLPILKSREDAPSNIYTIYQGTGLIIVSLLTYNIVLNPTPFSIAKIVERLGKRLRLPENTNFWNRLSIEEKLAKILVTLLETHFNKTTKLDQSNNTKGEDIITSTATNAPVEVNSMDRDVQLHIYSAGAVTDSQHHDSISSLTEIIESEI